MDDSTETVVPEAAPAPAEELARALGIGREAAERLVKAGYATPAEVRELPADTLAELGLSPDEISQLRPATASPSEAPAAAAVEPTPEPETVPDTAPAVPPDVVVRPVAPQSPPANSTADEPLVAAWRSCMGQALANYEQSHNLHALQAATSNCQMQLEAEGDPDLAGLEPSVPSAVPPMSGRRNIGCGWWPVGSDADRDCAAGGHRF